MSYRVAVDVYSGPLDLLIYLIKRTEIDIRDVSVAAIIDQFLGMIEQLRQEVDLELAGEFLVLASTLLELKSELLLPSARGDEGDNEQLRLGLVRQLIEYKRYRDLALALEKKRLQQARSFHRPEGLIQDEEQEDVYLEEVTVGDLFRAWLSMIVETELSMRTIVYDDRPVEEVLDELREKLPLDEWVPLTSIIGDPNDRGALIAIFWGILEFTKRQECKVNQLDDRTIVVMRLEPPEPTEIDDDDRLHHRDESPPDEHPDEPPSDGPDDPGDAADGEPDA